MINEEKVKVMNKLAMYECREGKKNLPVSKYYRSDYIGLALIKNFFLVTIGYCLVLAGIAVYFSDFLLENAHRIDLMALGLYIVGGYLLVLLAYSFLTYIQYAVKYYRAKKSVKKYYAYLTELGKMYEKEEKKNAGRGRSGGFKR